LRLIVALDIPSVAEARAHHMTGRYRFLLRTRPVARLATAFDGVLDELLKIGKKIFLGAKMFDIDEAVKRGWQEQQNAAVSFLAVHGDDYRPRAAVTGPSRGADRAAADYLVVGRPMVKSADPALAAARIIEDMRRAA
jgi:orotidine-5'-phosphate decarboxylase